MVIQAPKKGAKPGGEELWASGGHPGRLILGASLLATIALGLYLRWVLTGALGLSLPFGYLRHAHSHLGYFGLLFPLAWLGWSAAGVRIPGRIAWWAYAFCTGVACLGFIQHGYGAMAIAGCTAVSLFWLWSVLPLLSRVRDLQDPLGAMPFALVASLACVPPIAIYLRSHPALAQGFVSTFLSSLLLVVVVPSALAGRRIKAGPWPLWLGTGILASLYLGVAPHEVTQVGMVAYAGLILFYTGRARLEMHLRIAWAAVALGLCAMAIEMIPNIRPVALGAIHFLILGPILGTTAPLWLRRSPPVWLWCCGHLSWGIMSAALVLQAFVSETWTWTAAAWGGTATVLWWVVALIWSLFAPVSKAADTTAGSTEEGIMR